MACQGKELSALPDADLVAAIADHTASIPPIAADPLERRRAWEPLLELWQEFRRRFPSLVGAALTKRTSNENNGDGFLQALHSSVTQPNDQEWRGYDGDSAPIHWSSEASWSDGTVGLVSNP